MTPIDTPPPDSNGHVRAGVSSSVFWRVEGSLLNFSAVRGVAYFTWNAQSFLERWFRRWLLAPMAIGRPLLYASNRVFATRVLHSVLRGVSRDRLDLLGEEFFEYKLKPRLRKQNVERLRQCLEREGQVVLVSQHLDHVVRPLARHLGVERILCNRLEFRDGLATGRLLFPVVRPRGGLARLLPVKAHGRMTLDDVARDLGFAGRAEALLEGIAPARRSVVAHEPPCVLFDRAPAPFQKTASLRRTLAGRHILLIGGTGFIGKVWLTKLLSELPDIGRIYLLIRPRRSTAVRRFEKIIETSPVFEQLHLRHGDRLPQYIADRVEILEGDVCQPGLGLPEDIQERLQRDLDVVVNSSGLTDFNPDLRAALSANVDATARLLDFLRACDHAALLHLSTCYVAGMRDGRIPEQITRNYTPAGVAGFDVEREIEALNERAREIEERAQSAELAAQLADQLTRERNGNGDGNHLPPEKQLPRAVAAWLRNELVEAGMARSRELGWPNTYTFTKSLAESLIVTRGAGLPVAVVRPSIVESSVRDPFTGWNEGVNTSAPLSYLLGTYFRQLPSNRRKRLDIIPVDLVCRGMLLIAAALVERRHHAVYQLATSAVNPCDMQRSIELTCLAHRKHYLTQDELSYRFRARFDTIAVSKKRYEALSAPRQKAVVRAIGKLSAPFPNEIRASIERKERGLDRVEKLIELYEPFILHNEQMFEAEHVRLLSHGLPPDERDVFGYDPNAIDWWDYWINVHIPALRKWSYPLIDGRLPKPERKYSFRMPSGEEPAAATAAAAGAAAATAAGGPEAAARTD